jgi:hypothetical protein
MRTAKDPVIASRAGLISLGYSQLQSSQDDSLAFMSSAVVNNTQMANVPYSSKTTDAQNSRKRSNPVNLKPHGN